jgi:excisionase family DNA binding protein
VLRVSRYRPAPRRQWRKLHRPPVETDVEPLVSVREAAARTGVPVRVLRERIAAGEVPAIRVGRAVRLRLSDLEQADGG